MQLWIRVFLLMLSVLDPLLFALYVNELPSLISSPLLMFADDIKLYRIIRSPENCLQLQRDSKHGFYLLMLINVKCCTLVIQLFNNYNHQYTLHLNTWKTCETWESILTLN